MIFVIIIFLPITHILLSRSFDSSNSYGEYNFNFRAPVTSSGISATPTFNITLSPSFNFDTSSSCTSGQSFLSLTPSPTLSIDSCADSPFDGSSSSAISDISRSSFASTLLTPHEQAMLKLWCQRVGNKFELTLLQLTELGTFVNLSKNLDMGDLCLRIWEQATIYKIMNMVTANQVNYATFKSVLDDTTEHLLEGYKLSKDQQDQILILCKDLIIQPGCVEFCNFQFDLEEHICTNVTLLDFESIFGNAVHEKALRAILATINSQKYCNLETATFWIVEKIKWGRSGTNLNYSYQLLVAVLYYYAVDHYYKHGTMPKDINDEDEDEDDDESANPHPVKHSRTTPAGKIKKGVDFWLTIDRLLAVIITEQEKDQKSAQ
ncbi:hypothetical protein F5I97DRAFT_1932742 [Phlebopus sp. FC_14]|nr:hypothetical protein F5I97DRAFT_1932742 [Phlebopus sp. FC_14]